VVGLFKIRVEQKMEGDHWRNLQNQAPKESGVIWLIRSAEEEQLVVGKRGKDSCKTAC